MDNVEHVYHSAALVSFHKKHQKMMYEVNVKGTYNVVNQALSSKVKKIGHISSIAALEETALIITRKKQMEQ